MHEDLHGMAGPFALDALAPEERRRFEDHLHRCGTCHEEVPELAATAALLTTAVAERPPAGLRVAVLAEIAETRQVPPVLRPRAAGRPRQVARRRLLAVAAALLLAVGAVSLVDVGDGPSGTSEVAAVLASADAQVVDLRDASQGLMMRVVWSPSAGRAAVVGNDVADPGDDRVYELWAIGAHGPQPAGLVRPGPGGELEAVVETDLSEANLVGLTVEPAGGSPRPTSPVLASGTV